MRPAVRPSALTAALLGGIAWVAHLFVPAPALWHAGSVLLAAAVGLAGTRLARLPWLSAVAGFGAIGFGWSVVEAARQLGDVRVVEAVVGAGAALTVALLVLRSEPSSRGGNHRG